MVTTGSSGRVMPTLPEVDVDIKPKTDAAHDLGSFDKRWLYLYAVIAVMTSMLLGNIYVGTTGADNMTYWVNASGEFNGSLKVHSLWIQNSTGLCYENSDGGILSIWTDCNTPSIGMFWDGTHFSFKLGALDIFKQGLFDMVMGSPTIPMNVTVSGNSVVHKNSTVLRTQILNGTHGTLYHLTSATTIWADIANPTTNGLFLDGTQFCYKSAFLGGNPMYCIDFATGNITGEGTNTVKGKSWFWKNVTVNGTVKSTSSTGGLFEFENTLTTINNGKILGSLDFWGVDSGARIGARIIAQAKDSWGADLDDAKTSLLFFTEDTTTSSDIIYPKLIIDSDGNVNVNRGNLTVTHYIFSGYNQTGTNAGYDLCIDVNGVICACGYCA